MVFLEKLLEATQRPPLLWVFREGAGTGGEGDTSHQAGPDEWTVGDIRSSGSERESPVGGLTKPGSSRLPDICVSLWVHSPDGRPQGGGQDGVDLNVWQATFLSHGKSAGTDGETEAQDQPRTQGIGGGGTGVQEEKRERDGLRQ